MDILAHDWETERCRVHEVQERDLPAMASIFADNLDAIRSQGPDGRPEEMALSMLRHENLPPGRDPSHERSFLIADKSSEETIGLLSILCGYPTDKAFYIGSLFFRRDWQGQGLGREIVGELERRALEKGYDTAYVVVGLKNWPALRFWVAMGFNHINRIAGDIVSAETAYADVELTKRLNTVADL